MHEYRFDRLTAGTNLCAMLLGGAVRSENISDGINWIYWMLLGGAVRYGKGGNE